jgi:MFS superfamily sulfate permease-like transporter
VARGLFRENRVEGAICVLTLVAVVATDLLVGVVLGVCLSVLHLLHTFSRLRVRRRTNTGDDSQTLVLEGTATFVRLPKLAAALEAVPPGVTLRIDMAKLSYVDHACLTLLQNWGRQHEATGGTLALDWETLRSRFHTPRPRPRR